MRCQVYNGSKERKGENFMVTILECVMLVCFGISWPISVYKSLKSRSTQGKSILFTFAIIVGYLAGIASKIIAGKLNYVLALYIFNLIVVSFDCALFFVNRKREKQTILG